MDNAIEIRRFENPDEALDMKEAGGINIVKMSHGTTGMRAVFEPGWTWEKNEKPLLGSPDTCPMHHVGYCLSGKLIVRMVQTEKVTAITPGDFFEIPPGHDAYVEGSEKVELILFGAPS
ncbi:MULTISPECIES: cupin domain-containing protein [Sulfitobacter]|jgi:mannose-6-phosphate isomerase-like protein (cupin superfamily)|uniref:Cupin domain-containing protein n=1 Tax=Sulfitobacter profundi TaxID=2679961 RepID=A0ABW1Z3I0_9RHOB|nr:cupin domain-containing protein [Sulfitobacter indolifex]|tara:strand:- start:20 stop:376 length:357 start_codon:yes stop_codon:yes gene_type:complete